MYKLENVGYRKADEQLTVTLFCILKYCFFFLEYSRALHIICIKKEEASLSIAMELFSANCCLVSVLPLQTFLCPIEYRSVRGKVF